MSLDWKNRPDPFQDDTRRRLAALGATHVYLIEPIRFDSIYTCELWRAEFGGPGSGWLHVGDYCTIREAKQAAQQWEKDQTQ